MKILLIAIFVVVCYGVSAQQLILQAGLEKTVAGNQLYTSAIAENSKLWGLGLFCMASLGHYSAEETTSLAKPFYGAIIQVPLARTERIAVTANIRAGLLDDHFFIVTPSIETRIKVWERIGFAVASGIRMGNPSLQAKAYLKLF